jgi:hypothetical protein
MTDNSNLDPAYIKYKTRYIDLKKKSTNTDTNINKEAYIAELQNIYPRCIHDNTIKNAEKYAQYKTTYGEMEYDGIIKLNKIFNPDNNFKYFIDFGSGRGKLCLFMASNSGIKKSIGIELVKERHDYAKQIRQDLARTFPKYTEKVHLINGDMFAHNYNKIFDNNKVFVWLSNLCFGPDIDSKMFNKLARELTKGSIICCSKKPEYDMPTNLKHFDIIKLPMSWSRDSCVYSFEII